MTGPTITAPPGESTTGPRGLSVYVHVPFCATRCGYCDFNTYTADELGEGATRASYADTAILEVERFGRTGGRPPRQGRR